MQIKRRIILLVFLLWATGYACFAGDTTAHRFPQVLLVQLRTEQNRIKALTGQGKNAAAEEVRQDAISANTVMISDFTDNFKFCPVYYYFDTNSDLIKARKYDGILMNADGSSATQVPLTDTSKNYLVVFYGYSVQGEKKDDNAANSSKPLQKGLLINNYKMEQVSFLSKYSYQVSLFGTPKKDKKYTYSSKHFDIDYTPWAKELNDRLRDRIPGK